MAQEARSDVFLHFWSYGTCWAITSPLGLFGRGVALLRGREPPNNRPDRTQMCPSRVVASRRLQRAQPPCRRHPTAPAPPSQPASQGVPPSPGTCRRRPLRSSGIQPGLGAAQPGSKARSSWDVGYLYMRLMRGDWMVSIITLIESILLSSDISTRAGATPTCGGYTAGYPHIW